MDIPNVQEILVPETETGEGRQVQGEKQALTEGTRPTGETITSAAMLQMPSPTQGSVTFDKVILVVQQRDLVNTPFPPLEDKLVEEDVLADDTGEEEKQQHDEGENPIDINVDSSDATKHKDTEEEDIDATKVDIIVDPENQEKEPNETINVRGK